MCSFGNLEQHLPSEVHVGEMSLRFCVMENRLFEIPRQAYDNDSTMTTPHSQRMKFKLFILVVPQAVSLENSPM